MYGIMTQDGHLVLCHNDHFLYCLKHWDRNGNLVMRESSIEIDQLMQQYMTASDRYDLRVFRFTEEQEERLLIRRLRGY